MQNIVITNTYAPDMNKTIDERKNYWDKVEENIYTPKEKDNKIHIWLTDNNGQLGTTRKNDKNIGKYTYKKISEQGNGKNLEKIMREKNMRAINTFKTPTKKRGIKTWETTNENKKIQRQIDFIIINNNKTNWVERGKTGEIANKKKKQNKMGIEQ